MMASGAVVQRRTVAHTSFRQSLIFFVRSAYGERLESRHPQTAIEDAGDAHGSRLLRGLSSGDGRLKTRVFACPEAACRAPARRDHPSAREMGPALGVVNVGDVMIAGKLVVRQEFLRF